MPFKYRSTYPISTLRHRNPNVGLRCATCALAMCPNGWTLDVHLLCVGAHTFPDSRSLTRNKTTKFMRGMLEFVCLLIGKFGGSGVIKVVDTIQSNLFSLMCKRFLSEVETVPDDVPRKTVIIGLTKLLTETPEMHTQYAELWPLTISAVYRYAFEGEDGGDDVRG